MTVEQLIQEELQTDEAQEPAAEPLGVKVDHQTGEFELVPPREDDPAAQPATRPPESARKPLVYKLPYVSFGSKAPRPSNDTE